MQANPRDDWTIQDVAKLVDQEGLEMRAPKGGSHNVVSSRHLEDSLVVPARRPIKPIYIKMLTSFVQAHRERVEPAEGRPK